MGAALGEGQGPGDHGDVAIFQQFFAVAGWDLVRDLVEGAAAGDGSLGRQGRPRVRGQQQAPLQALQRGLGQVVGSPEGIAFLHVVLRARQVRRQLPVVGQQQQALRVPVQPAHGVQVPQLGRQQIQDGRVAGVLAGRNHVQGLVQQDGHLLTFFSYRYTRPFKVRCSSTVIFRRQ